MPGSVSLTGADTIQIDDRVLSDFADQDIAKLAFTEDLAKVKAGKNGNTIFALNALGKVADLELRLLLGSSDDQYLNGRMSAMLHDFSTFILITGFVTKRVGDGTGGVSSVVYQCAGGIIKRMPDVKSSAEGDTEQSVVIYMIQFGNNDRSIQ